MKLTTSLIQLCVEALALFSSSPHTQAILGLPMGVFPPFALYVIFLEELIPSQAFHHRLRDADSCVCSSTSSLPKLWTGMPGCLKTDSLPQQPNLPFSSPIHFSSLLVSTDAITLNPLREQRNLCHSDSISHLSLVLRDFTFPTFPMSPSPQTRAFSLTFMLSFSPPF